MQFGLLGSLQVVADSGEVVELGGSQPRTLLAMLLASSARTVPVDSLIEGIWGERPSASAGSMLQSYVSRLRRQLPAKILVWEPPGYRLDVDADQVDFRRFERLADEGRELLSAGSPGEARVRLIEALELWRGPALAEFPDSEFAIGLAARLEERRLTALEDRFAADLDLGRHSAIVGELTELVRQHGLREQLWGQLALALYRSGRQADALRTLDDMRRLLRDELGVDPSPPLRELEQRILEQDPTLAAPAAAASPAPAMQTASTPPVELPEHDEDLFSASRIVGRDAELSQLTRALDESLHGRARLAVVEGEPGIGKTRLLEELSQHASERGAAVRWGRCHEGGAAPAFWPWIEVLRPLVAGPGTHPASESHLARLLSPHAGDAEPGQADRFMLFDEIAGVLERAAAEAPVVVVIDDVQWADPASLDLLEFLAGRLDHVAALLVVSVRELEIGRNDSVVRALAALSRRPSTRRLHLRGLGLAEAGVLVQRATGEEASPSLVATIRDRADGNPFFMTELARLIVTEAATDEAELVRRAGVPASVRDVVSRRLAGLPDATMAVLQAAAVLGRDADLTVLTQAAGIEPVACLEALEPAVATRLLAVVPDAPATFRFAHALVREVVLEEVSPLQRARLHLQAARAIDSVVGINDDTAELVADHLWAATPLADRREVAAALLRAGAVAVRRFAYESADVLLDRAVQLSRSTSDNEDDLNAELTALSQHLNLRRMLHGYTKSRETMPLERVRELANRTGRIDVLNELLWAEWAGAATACDWDVAVPMAEQLLQLGEQSGDTGLWASGHGAWAIQCWHLGRVTDAVKYLDMAMAAEKMHDLHFASQGVHVENRILTAGFHCSMHELAGDRDDADERVAALLSNESDRYGRTLLYTVAAWCGSIGGDPTRAARAGRRAMEADPDGAFPFYSAAAAMFRAWGLAELGEVDEALELYDVSWPAYNSTRVRTIVPFHRAQHAVAFTRAGRTEDALATLESAWAMLRETKEAWQEPAVLMYGADVHHHAGAPVDEVATMLRKAVDLATEQGSLRFAKRSVALARRLGIDLEV